MSERSTEIQFNLYCDLAIDRLKKIKSEFSDALDRNSLAKIKQISKDMRDSKHIFYELQSIVNEKKTELRNLIETDLT